jgi:4-oxalocrotonate tautomerase
VILGSAWRGYVSVSPVLIIPREVCSVCFTSGNVDRKGTRSGPPIDCSVSFYSESPSNAFIKNLFTSKVLLTLSLTIDFAIGENAMPVVNIQMFEGRDEGKAAIAKAVTDAIVQHGNVDPQYVYVIFNDVKMDDWAISGELFSETLKKHS